MTDVMTTAALSAIPKPGINGKLRSSRALWPMVVGISSIPVAWFLGVGFIWYHILAITWAARNPRAFRAIGAVDIAFYLLVSTLAFSLTFSPARGYGSLDRMFGAANNISLIVVYYLCYKTARYVANSGIITDEAVAVIFRNIRNIFKLFLGLGVVLAVIWYLLGQYDWSTRTVFGFLVPDLPGILGEYQQTALVNTDYLFGAKIPRVSIFAPFATTAAAVLMLLTGIGYLLRAGVKTQGAKLTKKLGLMSYISVFATIARASILAVTVAWTLRYMVGRGRALGLLVSLLALLVLYYLYATGVGLFDLLNEARPGSSAARLGNYDASVSLVMSESPFYGLGVKPRLDVSFIPLGSHSSWISYLVRGGIIGTALASLFYVFFMFWNVAKIVLGYAAGSPRYDLYAITGALMACGFLSYYSVQDVDAYGVVAFLAGTYAGLLSVVATQGTVVNVAPATTGIRVTRPKV